MANPGKGVLLRITNPDIRGGRIANPPELGWYFFHTNYHKLSINSDLQKIYDQLYGNYMFKNRLAFVGIRLVFVGNQRSAAEGKANCNPDVLNIRIFNPIIALQMLIFHAVGL